eukprot:3780661-Pleurochrysis_carterae.AAC.1
MRARVPARMHASSYTCALLWKLADACGDEYNTRVRGRCAHMRACARAYACVCARECMRACEGARSRASARLSFHASKNLQSACTGLHLLLRQRAWEIASRAWDTSLGDCISVR